MSVPVLTTTQEIEELAAVLAGEGAIAVDLEADSMHCYQEKVCLLQFSTADRTWLVDPLAGPDLAPLGPVLADPAVRKIFHAADYDLRSLRRDFGLTVRGLFDTMVAAQFLGEEKIGLADVLLKHFGVELDKQYQRADWAQRPLPAGMLHYAAEDTRHLHRLADLFEGELAAKGRLEWAGEEFALLEAVRFQATGEAPLFVRAKGAAALDRRGLAILELLLQWRDGEARRRDCPLFKVIGTKSLLEIARIRPRAAKGLVGIEGVPPRLADRYGRELLGCVEEGLAKPEEELPIFPRGERRLRDPEVEGRLTKLKEWRSGKAVALAMDPGIVINNATLEELARQAPRQPEELVTVPGLKRWQQTVLGDELLQLLQACKV
ncbi:MAG: ribonuclease D [Desulfuromonadales bacterium]|nr:ribonuclease D [Desulfuromonadales bacterium]